jgi:hypothetical protein
LTLWRFNALMYCIGNCYCWALILKFFHGGEVFTLGSEVGAKGREVEHYMLKDRNGRIRHFKRVFDFLPEPLCYFCFIGKIEKSGKNKDDSIFGC